MKYAKSAAVIVGSMLALGSASPALAGTPGSNYAAGADGPNFSLDNGLQEALQEHPLEDAILEESPVGVDGPLTDSLKNAATGLAGSGPKNAGRHLLGGE